LPHVSASRISLVSSSGRQEEYLSSSTIPSLFSIGYCAAPRSVSLLASGLSRLDRTIPVCRCLAAHSLRGGYHAHVHEQREKSVFAAYKISSGSGPEERDGRKGKAQMMLFSDEHGRLYLIFVDVNRKTTWVPLPSSTPFRRGTVVTVENAEKGDIAPSELNRRSQTQRNGGRSGPPTPGTSNDEVTEGQKAGRVGTPRHERTLLKGVSACGQTLSPSCAGSG
jgi:hypothetical protein